VTTDQTRRYARQIALPTVGHAGQERILATSVAVLGDGLAARFAARYLEAAGARVSRRPDAGAQIALDLGAEADAAAGALAATRALLQIVEGAA